MVRFWGVKPRGTRPRFKKPGNTFKWPHSPKPHHFVFMKINLKEFRLREEYINEQKHPVLDLIIWNYNQKCQFNKAWDKYTLMARGLITDSEGNIVARPFSKFFNWGEGVAVNVPTEMPIITEKLDGSLGIQYYDGEQVCIATRGSFSSDQAIWATEWMRGRGFHRKDFLPDKTYLYEIIGRHNRIVVDYGDRAECVLLAVIDTDNGYENEQLNEVEAKRLGLGLPQKFHPKNVEEILKTTTELSGNEEGYVFHWPKFSNLRIKLKGKEYVRLHKLLTEFSTIALWEALKERRSFDEVLERVPDEFYDWVRKNQEKLVSEFELFHRQASNAWLDVVKLPDRKSQALEIMRSYPQISSLVFSMLDGKDPSKDIWKRIRPVYEKPFAKDVDNSH